jgi:hypothetical protein
MLRMGIARSEPSSHRHPGLNGKIDVTDFSHGTGYGPLHRVIWLHIILWVNTQLLCERQHAGVFAGAVVVNLLAVMTFAHQGVVSILLDRPMGATLIQRLVVARLAQHRTRNPNMLRFAIVRGTGERDFLVDEPEAVGRTTLDHRNALKRLDGRTRIDGGGNAALGGHHMAALVDDAPGTAMAAFDNAAAGNFGDDGVHHDTGSRRDVL